MPVTAADLKFFASAVMSDLATAGGARSSTLVQNGTLNNLFASFSSADRSTGRTNIRKLWPSISNADTAALIGASVAINELPTDSFTMVDADASYRLTAGAGNVFLFLRGSNLLDEDARQHASPLKDVVPLPGRSFHLGARAEF